MTKADLTGKIQEKISCQKKEAVELMEFVIETLKDTITAAGHAKISGFGNFVIRQKAARNGRNPQPGNASNKKTLLKKHIYNQKLIDSMSILNRILTPKFNLSKNAFLRSTVGI